MTLRRMLLGFRGKTLRWGFARISDLDWNRGKVFVFRYAANFRVIIDIILTPHQRNPSHMR
jgi:hypothetical protein